ncbi:hypothetical protein [Polaribacter sp.]|uniref:hypothetical protein n=1 Tax=Polaribacter sp. TaxID=1920175 RepID=UPI003F6AEF24
MNPKNQIKYGFLISKKKIFDTKIQSYQLKKEIVDNLVIYRMMPNRYKRLRVFENLLSTMTNDAVFDILKNDADVKKKRSSNIVISEKTLLNASNMAMVYNYPPKYLTQKRFYLYKSCQTLKKRIDNE